MCCKAYCDAYLRLNGTLEASYLEESLEELKLGKNDHCLTNLYIFNVSNSCQYKITYPGIHFSFLIDSVFHMSLLIDIKSDSFIGLPCIL